jgi:3-(3-hydroxy-phenyl)propionate hydroxylase
MEHVAMTKHAVVIAGGGPTGLMLAGELALVGSMLSLSTRWPVSRFAAQTNA